MLVTEQEICDLRDFVISLNEMKDSIVVVEGKRDVAALRGLGFSGNILQFYKTGGFANFADVVARYKSVIILFDRDKKGRYLTGRVIRLLERRTKIDLSFKKRLCAITRGQIVFTEQLCCYEPYLS